MQQHQHGPNCRHGPAHGQAHGFAQSHQHSIPQGLGFSNQLHEMPPNEYFRQLRKKFSDNRLFFWHQILIGLSLNKLYEKMGFQFMRSLSCQMAMMIVGSIEMAISFDWIPKQLKHITSGLFFPLLFLFFFNFNVVVGIGNSNQLLKNIMIITLSLYALVGLRGSGQLNNEKVKAKCKEIFTIRPYVQNPAMNCNACGVLRFFRSVHCPICKSCVAKHSRHSVVFSICIGAANQLLALLFFIFLSLTEVCIIWLFFNQGSYGFLTKLMFYLLNLSICWMSLVEFFTLLTLNFIYGITEQELKTWPMQQHLLKIPEREFQNNVDQGFITNVINSLYATFGISGFESVNRQTANPLAFQQIDSSQTYKINWAKASFYLIPQLPCHKNREQIQEMLQREEPRMIEMYRLQLKLKAEIISQAGNEPLNQFQMQQKLAMRMQAHMMKNMPQMSAPSTDQQKTIQLQMLAHMKKQFAAESDLAQQIDELSTALNDSKMTPIETNMRMRQLQQELMQRRMSKVAKQHQENIQKKREEEEEAPMVRLADEDL